MVDATPFHFFKYINVSLNIFLPKFCDSPETPLDRRVCQRVCAGHVGEGCLSGYIISASILTLCLCGNRLKVQNYA